MAGLDFRKELRQIANAAQDANVTRLLAGEAVSGGTLEPPKSEAGPSTSRRRVRIFGSKIAVKNIQRLGIKSGDMLKDAGRRSNVKLGRTSFKIVPSPAIRARWFAFNAGTKNAAARPFSGISDQLLTTAGSLIASAGKSQLVARLNKRAKP